MIMSIHKKNKEIFRLLRIVKKYRHTFISKSKKARFKKKNIRSLQNVLTLSFGLVQIMIAQSRGIIKK